MADPIFKGLSYKVSIDGLYDTYLTFSVNETEPVNNWVGDDPKYAKPPVPYYYGTNFAQFLIDHNFPNKIIFTNGNYLEKYAGFAGWSKDKIKLSCQYHFCLKNGDWVSYKNAKGVKQYLSTTGHRAGMYMGNGSGQLVEGSGVWINIGLGTDFANAQYFGGYNKYYDPQWAGYKDVTGELYEGYNPGDSEYAMPALREFFSNADVEPYYGDVSTTGGGDGSYTVTNNPVDFAPIPTISAVTSGLISLYSPTATQINDLANFLWSEDFFVNVAKTFNNPIDMIIGLSIFPLTPPIVGAQEVKIGNIASTITMNKIGQQFLTLDCGTIDVAEYWGSALDYAPFSKMSIFLPYIGTKELNIDDVMGKTIHLRYAIDLLTGSCNAELKCGDSVLYSFTGSVNSPIPITGTDWSGLTRSLISAVVGTGVAVATGGAGAAIAAGVAGAANSVINGKPNVQKTGAIAGTSGLLSQQTPYLIYELPRQSRAENYNATMGLPSNIYAKLSTLKGFTKLSKIHLEKISATAAEAAEIEKLLYEGVIL